MKNALLVLSCLFCFVNTTAAQSFHQSRASYPSPAAGTVFVYPERIELKSGELLTVDRGLMFVPLNRQKEETDVIAVEFYRIPRSEEADPTTPPIFSLRGGPGFPGLASTLAKKGNFDRLFNERRKLSDIVVVGQRGIGSSKPDTLTNETLPALKTDKLVDSETRTRQLREVLTRERDFWIEQGLDLSGFNVVEAAADVHDIAKALGYEQVIVTGGSFGSHWGMTVIRNYPDLVARAVLDGMEGPDHTWDHPGWYWNVFKRVAEDAEASEALEGLIPEGGLIAAAEAQAEKAKADPFEVKYGSNNKQTMLIDHEAMCLMLRGNGNLAAWPSEIIKLHHGEYANAGVRVGMQRLGRKSYGTASFWLLDSASGITEKRRAEYEADPAMEIIGSTFWYYSAGSPLWNVDLGDEFRGSFSTDVPTVIVHGTWDVSTPYENAVELAPYFKNRKFVTVKRGSHNALREAKDSFPEFNKALNDFIKTGNMSSLPEQLELPATKWVVPRVKTSK